MRRIRLGRHIRVVRLRGGIPSISAPNQVEAARALGYNHALDRGAQIEISRLLAQGRASEHLSPDPLLVRFDSVIRRLGLHRYPERDVDALWGETRGVMQAYVEGVNSCHKARGRSLLLRFLGHRPSPWTVNDLVLIHRLMSFAGLINLQLTVERTVVDLIRANVPMNLLQELFGPHLANIDPDLIRSVEMGSGSVGDLSAVSLLGSSPITASSAFAIAGRRTATRSAILGFDTHTDVSRLPAILYEAEIHLPETSIAGATVPGIPGVISGRNRDVGWAATYAYGDTADLFVEECRGGKRLVAGEWEPFEERVEELSIRGGEVRRFAVYTSGHGVLEGNPYVPGRYLSLCWTGQPGSFHSSYEGILRLNVARSVDEAREAVRSIRQPAFTWVFADSRGNIGYQLAGTFPRRRREWSGLYPVAGWDPENDWRGFVDARTLPGRTNPEQGFFVAANEGLWPTLSNTPLAGYRFRRLRELLSVERGWNVTDAMRLQYDLISHQAKRLMPLFLQYVEGDEERRILSHWKHSFHTASRSAGLYEDIYRAALVHLFGDGGMGRARIAKLLDTTPFLLGMAERLDAIILNRGSLWLEGRDYDTVLADAVREGLTRPRTTWGERHLLPMDNRLLGDRLPALFRLQRRPLDLPGHHSTIHYACRVGDGESESVIGPSYRFVADMGSDEIWTNIPGGPSENPLSRYYTSDLTNWRFGDYTRLRVRHRK